MHDHCLVCGRGCAAGVIWLSRWQRESGLRPLYTSLSPEDANAIVQKLHEGGVDYQRRRQRHRSAGARGPGPRAAPGNGRRWACPKPGASDLRFSTKPTSASPTSPSTSTIAAPGRRTGTLRHGDLGGAAGARARDASQGFRLHAIPANPPRPACWSVCGPATRLSAPNVIAITNLVSSAVEGLTPESVSVVDMNGNLLSRPRRDGPPDGVADQRSSARIQAGHRTRPGREDQQYAGAAARRRQIPHRRVGRHRHDQRRTKRRNVRSFQVRDGLVAENGRHEHRLAGLTRHPGNGRESADQQAAAEPAAPAGQTSADNARAARSSGGASQTAKAQTPARRRESAATPAAPTAAPKASPINPAASPSTSSCRKELSNACPSRCWWIRASKWEGQGKQMHRVVMPPDHRKAQSHSNVWLERWWVWTPMRGDQLTVEALPFDTRSSMPSFPALRRPSAQKKPEDPLSLEALKKKPALLYGSIGGAVAHTGPHRFRCRCRRRQAPRNVGNARSPARARHPQ